MIIVNNPCCITPRLLPGIKINDSFLSIKYDCYHQRYTIYLDTPEFEYSDSDICSGIFGGTLKEGLSSCLSFMFSCGESVNYTQRTGRRSDNSDLYPEHVANWCADNENELGILYDEVKETKNCIIEV